MSAGDELYQRSTLVPRAELDEAIALLRENCKYDVCTSGYYHWQKKRDNFIAKHSTNTAPYRDNPVFDGPTPDAQTTQRPRDYAEVEDKYEELVKAQRPRDEQTYYADYTTITRVSYDESMRAQIAVLEHRIERLESKG